MTSIPNAEPAVDVVRRIVDELLQRRQDRLSKSKGLYPKNQPRASDIDPDTCMRRQVLSIVKWDEAKPFGNDLKARFEVGDVHEREAVRELLDLGFTVVHQQVDFELTKRGTDIVCLRGRVDGMLSEPKLTGRKQVPFEVKGLSPFQYDRINSVQDLLDHPWYRKYVHQMQAYLVGFGYEAGFFWITNGLGKWKAIVMELDLELAERCWSFAEEIVDRVATYQNTHELPPYTENTEQCFDCAFFKRSCQPEITNEGALVYENGKLAETLEERAAVEEAGRQFQRLDRRVKGWLKKLQQEDPKLAARDRLIVGGFMIEFDEVPYQGYTVEPGIRRVPTITSIKRPEGTVTLEDLVANGQNILPFPNENR